jgi:hypothetical protein
MLKTQTGEKPQSLSFDKKKRKKEEKCAKTRREIEENEQENKLTHVRKFRVIQMRISSYRFTSVFFFFLLHFLFAQLSR